MIVGAALAIACGGTTGPPSDASSDAPTDATIKDDSAPIPFYGAAPFDSGTDVQDASSDTGDENDIALYGGAPPPHDG